jgi:Transcriptional regulator PadR-like family
MSETQIALLKVTLDMLVIKVAALGPSHGYAIAQRLQQISKDFFHFHQGSLPRAPSLGGSRMAASRVEGIGDWAGSQVLFAHQEGP